MIASTPPMGWNSWDCYGAEVTEETVRKNAAYMADHLKEYGWEYIVVDIQWAGGEGIWLGVYCGGYPVGRRECGGPRL